MPSHALYQALLTASILDFVVAGLGLVAKVPFKKGACIGFQMGGSDGLEPHRMQPGQAGDKIITCCPFWHWKLIGQDHGHADDKQSQVEIEATKKSFDVNAVVKRDMFVVATAVIKEGDEIFINCR